MEKRGLQFLLLGVLLAILAAEIKAATTPVFTISSDVKFISEATAGSQSTVARITITSTTAVAADTAFNIAYSGTAVAADFAGGFATATATILNGQTTTTFNLTALDDANYEMPEYVKISFSKAGTLIGVDRFVYIVVHDNDDRPTVSLETNVKFLLEATETSIVVTARASKNVIENSIVQFDVIGTNVDHGDFKGNFPKEITINAGASTGQVTLTIKNDGFAEGLEIGTFVISEPTPHIKLGPVVDVTFSLVDSGDLARVSVSTSNEDPPENGGKTKIIVTSSKPVVGTQTVDLGFTGTNVVAGDMVGVIPSKITILNGQTTGEVEITMQDDAIYEEVEIITWTISNPTAGIVLGPDTKVDTEIIDDDPRPTVVLDAITGGSEAAQTVINIKVTASANLLRPSTLDLTIFGNGVTKDDFFTFPTSITIPGGANTQTITMQSRDDGILEANPEVVSVSISNPTDVLQLGATTIQTFNIVDSLAKKLASLSVDRLSGAEATNDTFTVTATLTSTATVPITIPLNVVVSPVGGANDIVGAIPPSIVIPAGSISSTAVFRFFDDVTYESTQTWKVTAQRPTPVAQAALGSSIEVTFTVADNEQPPKTTIVASPRTVVEKTEDTVFFFTWSANDAVTDVVFDFDVQGTGLDLNDFKPFQFPKITLQKGNSVVTTTLQLDNDPSFEGTEVARPTIENPIPAHVRLVGGKQQGIFSIIDDEIPTKCNIHSFPLFGEEKNNEKFNLTVTCDAAVIGAQAIPLQYSGASAADFQAAFPANITIPNGATQAALVYQLKDDATFEGTEVFTIRLLTPHTPNIILGTDVETKYQIIDNEPQPVVTVSVSPLEAFEAAETSVEVTVAAGSPVIGDQQIRFSIGGTGIEAEDFLPGVPEFITIKNGETIGTATFHVRNDGVAETKETAQVRIFSPTANIALNLNSRVATFVIRDSGKKPVIELQVTPTSVTESTGTTPVVSIIAKASEKLVNGGTVTLSITGDVVPADFDGLAAFPTVISIPGDSDTGKVDLAVFNDFTYEGIEKAFIKITQPPPEAVLAFSNKTEGSFVINDNDSKPSLVVSVTSAAPTEAAQTSFFVRVTANKPTVSASTVNVAFSTVDQLDFLTTLPTQITIPKGGTQGQALLQVRDDGRAEGAEACTVTISNPSADVSIGTATTAFTITDSGTKTQLSLSVTPLGANAVKEADSTQVSIIVTASANLAATAIVNVTVSGTGVTPADFGIDNFDFKTHIVIPRGANTGKLTLTVFDDPIFEGTETVTVAFIPLSTPAGAVLGDVRSVTFNIIDSDPAPNVQVSLAPFSGAEILEDSFNMLVFASNNVMGDQSVSVTYSGANVDQNDFLTTLPPKVVIKSGTTSTTSLLTIRDDALSEGTEVAVVTISTPTEKIILGSVRTQTATISDDEIKPSVKVTVAPSEGKEGAGTVFVISAVADGVVVGDATVSLAISGAGVNPSDFGLVIYPTQIKIPDGTTNGNVQLTIFDDNVAEGNETATATISNPSANIILSSTATTSFTLADNENIPPVVISANPTTASETGQTNVTITITAVAPVVGTQTVILGLSGLNVQNDDFINPPSTVQIANGQKTGTAVFQIRDDTVAEGTEVATVTITSVSAGLVIGSPKEVSFTIQDNEVLAGDKPPVVANPIPDVEAPKNSPSIIIDLSNVFTDPDSPDSGITKSVASNTDTNLVTTSITGNSLTLTITPNLEGFASITILGSSLSKTANDTFTVTVGTPAVTTVVAAQTAVFEDSSSSVDVVFRRAQQLSTDIIISFTVSGTAKFNTIKTASDYIVAGATTFTATEGTVTIPKNAESVVLKITPEVDTLAEGTETITIQLKKGPGYSVGSPDITTIRILELNTGSLPIPLLTGSPFTFRVNVLFEKRSISATAAEIAKVRADVSNYLRIGVEFISAIEQHNNIWYVTIRSIAGESAAKSLVVTAVSGINARAIEFSNGPFKNALAFVCCKLPPDVDAGNIVDVFPSLIIPSPSPSPSPSPRPSPKPAPSPDAAAIVTPSFYLLLILAITFVFNMMF